MMLPSRRRGLQISYGENGERRLDLIEFLEVAQVLRIDVAALIHDLQNYKADQQKN